jgi:hypothetical protein
MESWQAERILAPVFCIWMFGGELLFSPVAPVIVLASSEKSIALTMAVIYFRTPRIIWRRHDCH